MTARVLLAAMLTGFGGGNRGFLFVVKTPRGRYSWFFQNSASAVDLAVPIKKALGFAATP